LNQRVAAILDDPSAAPLASVPSSSKSNNLFRQGIRDLLPNGNVVHAVVDVRPEEQGEEFDPIHGLQACRHCRRRRPQQKSELGRTNGANRLSDAAIVALGRGHCHLFPSSVYYLIVVLPPPPLPSIIVVVVVIVSTIATISSPLACTI
jgi:hypothetical protein